MALVLRLDKCGDRDAAQRHPDDMAEQRYAENADAEAPPPPPPRPADGALPLRVHLSAWPARTAHWCWSCCLSFDTPPVFIPSGLQRLDDNDVVFDVLGNFCSFGCAQTFINTTLEEHIAVNRAQVQQNLCFLYFCVFGKHVKIFAPAPVRWRHCRFGGPLSDAEFARAVRGCIPPGQRPAAGPAVALLSDVGLVPRDGGERVDMLSVLAGIPEAVTE